MLSRQSERRLLTRSAVSLDVSLPRAYKDKLRHIPGIDMVTEYQWIPTYYKEPRNLMLIVACNPDFVGYDPEIAVSKSHVDALRADRNGVLVPVKMARRYGWKIGDRLTFPGTGFPFDLNLRIVGTFSAVAQSFLVCHYELFNELARRTIPGRADRTMAFMLRVETPEMAPRIATEIDAMFRNSPAPTRTESERSFILGFGEMIGNVRVFISMIAAAVIFAIALVTTNTMSMAVRERTHEIAMLKTLGFAPRTVLMLILGESLAISAAGGLAGVVAARVFFRTFDIYDLTDGVVQHFQITPVVMMQGLALAIVMATISSIVPAWRGAAQPIASSLRGIG